jgi:hypothetical protein
MPGTPSGSVMCAIAMFPFHEKLRVVSLPNTGWGTDLFAWKLTSRQGYFVQAKRFFR